MTTTYLHPDHHWRARLQEAQARRAAAVRRALARDRRRRRVSLIMSICLAAATIALAACLYLELAH